MGCRILVGREGDGREQAILFCSTSGWAFGPVFDETGHTSAGASALCFERFVVEDPRAFPVGELERLYGAWLVATRLRDDEWCTWCDGSGEPIADEPLVAL